MSDGYDSCLLSCKPCEGCGQHIPKNRTYCEKCTPDATAGDGLREILVESLNGTTPWVDHDGFIGRASARDMVDLHILPALRNVLAAAARDAEKVRRVEELANELDVDSCDPMPDAHSRLMYDTALRIRRALDPA